jgi:hypothetical protein
MRTAFAAVGVALVMAGGVVSPALAAPPKRDFFTDQQTRVVESVCPFPVTVVATFPGTRQVDFYSRDGVLKRTAYHIVEQDTFTANGKTLVGVPYRFRTVANFNESGEVTSAYGTGHHVRVPLPDGRTFFVAGRVNFLQQVNDFVWVPDSGASKNAAAFCAALAL